MREPDLTNIAKTLTSKRLQCTNEIRVLMDCMARQGLIDSDTACQRQVTAAILCLQTATKAGNARAELGKRLASVAKLFARNGFR